MRGWKVRYHEDSGVFQVGPNRGEVREVRVLALARSSQDGHHYLVYEAPDLPERYEAPLLDYLARKCGGSWDLVPVEVVEPRWGKLPLEERVQALRREGFEITSVLP